MANFVKQSSIVREIWGKGDTILVIFAGASAEFALNKAVDWLYFTGKLPADPIGRLFSTVGYAHRIVYAELEGANKTIDSITNIHSAVEKNRGGKIPDWAYRDVLFMLIDYSIRAFELLERKLSHKEKEEVFDVFYRMGERMELKGLPENFSQFIIMREEHLENDLKKSHFTVDLFKQYKKHLGPVRYQLLKETQVLVVPERVRKLLGLKNFSLLRPMVFIYQILKILKFDWYLKKILLPGKYLKEIKMLDRK